MRVIQNGDVYNLYDNSVKAYDRLPPKTYTLEYDRMTGCYLMEHSDLALSEKVYGEQESKVKKVLNAFGRCERSLGVILSGDKGIGKTMFAKRLCQMAQQLRR